MNTTAETAGLSLSPNRGYSFKSVNHDGPSIQCLDSGSQEVFPGIFVTVDPASGIALIEINPNQKTARVCLNGEEVLDLAQINRRDLLAIDGKTYVFLRYMDAYFNVNRSINLQQDVAVPSVKVVRIIKASENRISSTLVSKYLAFPLRMKIMLSLTTFAVIASLGAIFSNQSVEPDLNKGQAVVQNVEVAKKVPVVTETDQVPTTLNELLEEPKPLSQKQNSPRPDNQTTSDTVIKKNRDLSDEKGHIEPKAQQSATWIKPKGKNTIKKASVVSVPSIKPDATAMKSFEKELQEAVLIRGYDLERSNRILRQLQKKVPKGTPLRAKIEKELR